MEKINIISEEYFEGLRQEGDPIADHAFLALKKDRLLAEQFYRIEQNQALIDVNFQDVDFQKFINLFKTQYEELDREQLAQGQAVFHKYTAEILGMLGFYSLPYCYAGAKGARVLYLSKKIKENPEKRLIETGQFVFDVSEKEAFSPHGKALVSIARVRLMHAAARFYSKEQILDEVAVNQEDLLATMLSFSLISIRGLRKTGIDLSKQESLQFIQMWNSIGLLLGINPELIPRSINEASAIERLIRKRQFKFSKEGKELTSSLLNYLSSQELAGFKFDTKGYMAMLLGKSVAENVGLKVSEIETSFFKNASKARSFFAQFSETNFVSIKSQLDKVVAEKSLKAEYKAV
ncbi:MAG: oxygenase MpaB family protein [Cyclobacteriaceae bacterium]